MVHAAAAGVGGVAGNDAGGGRRVDAGGYARPFGGLGRLGGGLCRRSVGRVGAVFLDEPEKAGQQAGWRQRLAEWLNAERCAFSRHGGEHAAGVG